MRLRATLLLIMCCTSGVPGAHADPADLCAKDGNDDTIRPYDRRLRPEFVRAYKRLFPKSHGIPGDPMLAANASSRCMDGQLVACFAGGTLPCARISTPGGHSPVEVDTRGFAKAVWTPLD